MLYSAILVLMSSTFIMLRLGGGGSFPRPLKKAEEEEYVTRWVEQGDLEARNLLIEHNLRLVAHVMKKYVVGPEETEDLISIGTIGLIKGINTYRPDKGVRLATYASKCIENEILMHFRSQKKSAGDLSLSDSIDLEGDGSRLSLMDVLSQEDELLERVGDDEICQQLREYVDTVLDPREGRIIKLRYGLENGLPMTQRETAQAMGISRSYVSRIEKRALEKLNQCFDER